MEFPPTPDWIAEGERTDTMLGRSVGAGDWNGDGYDDLIVGAPRYDNGQTNEGGAFAYYGSAAGLSTTPDWVAESNNAGAEFGVAVESVGDVNADGYDDAIVGAYFYDGGQTDEGAAFLYYGSAAGLSPTPGWHVEGDQSGAQMGVFVDAAGDVNGDGYPDVIVGARYYDGGGRAFVYYGGPAGLSPTPNWTADGSGSYGICVAPAGDINADGYADVLVGAYRYSNGQYSEGAAYAYYGSAAGLSTSPNWQVEGNVDGANLGWMVAPAGDVNGDGYDDAFVGTIYADGYGTGRADVYYGSAAGLSPTPNWTMQGEQYGSYTGFSGGLAGDVDGDGYDDVLVGALYYGNGQSREGKAYLYLGAAGGLSQTPAWTVEGEQVGAIMGDFAGKAGDVNGDGGEDWVVAAPWYDNGQVDEGRVYLYYGATTPPPPTATPAPTMPPPPPTATPAPTMPPPPPTIPPPPQILPCWMDEGDQPGAWMGTFVAAAGDVNGDGYDDVAFPVDLYDNGQVDEGRVYLYYGAPAGLGSVPDWITEGEQAGAQYGVAVGTAGDVNGDGYDDLVVGARYYDNGQADEGRAYAYYGSAAGLSTIPDWIVESNQAGAAFGRHVSTGGDVNGDGYDEVLVGAYGYSNGQSEEGAVFLYNGSPSGLNPVANWTFESNQSGARLGWWANPAGDVNGDGYDDLIVGAYAYSNGQSRPGAAFAFYGSVSGLSLVPDWVVIGSQGGSYFGYTVDSAGDVNGDGYDDVIIGAPFYDNGQVDEGAVFVYLGSATGLSTTPAWVVDGDQIGAGLGIGAGPAGDINSDGYDDVVAGSYQYDNGQTNEGAAFVYLGSAAGLSMTPFWMAEGDQVGATFGDAVSTVGDINGDGFPELLVGAPLYDHGETNEGAVFLYCAQGSPPPPPCNPVHDVDFSWSPLDPLVGEEVNFSASAAGTLPIDFYWQFGDGAVGSGDTVAHVYTAAGTYNVTLVATNACGQAAVNYNITVRQGTNSVYVDIKPGSCPNPVNPRDVGVLPVAVLGTAEFDVIQIDPASVRLIGVAPLRWSYEDVATPVDSPEYCACTTAGPDGYVDLVLHFDVQEVLAALPWPYVDTAKSITDPPGMTFLLPLEATLAGGAPVHGQDCIIVQHTNFIE